MKDYQLEVGDKMIVVEGIRKGDIGKVTRVEDDTVCVITERCITGYRISKDLVEYYNPNYYLVTEMATVATSTDPQLHIEVNPDRKRKGNPYFKVLDTASFIPNKSKACRLHFKDSEMEYHTGDGLLRWKITNKDVKAIKKLLNKRYDDVPEYTNWQMCCWLWNLEYGFEFFNRSHRDAYFAGEFDEKFKDHPSYVPSTQEIPETWEYKPSKNKR